MTLKDSKPRPVTLRKPRGNFTFREVCASGGGLLVAP